MLDGGDHAARDQVRVGQDLVPWRMHFAENARCPEKETHRLAVADFNHDLVGDGLDWNLTQQRKDLPQLLCDQATVYRHRIASDKRRSVRTQPHDGFRNLFWLAHPADWLHSDEARLRFRTH